MTFEYPAEVVYERAAQNRRMREENARLRAALEAIRAYSAERMYVNYAPGPSPWEHVNGLAGDALGVATTAPDARPQPDRVKARVIIESHGWEPYEDGGFLMARKGDATAVYVDHSETWHNLRDLREDWREKLHPDANLPVDARPQP